MNIPDAAEHGHRQTKDGDWECKCGVPIRPGAPSNWMHKHLIEVTEAAVRERVARDIEDARSQAPAWVAESHLSTWQAALAYAARIANGEQP